jgi:hypothetical protein
MGWFVILAIAVHTSGYDDLGLDHENRKQK